MESMKAAVFKELQALRGFYNKIEKTQCPRKGADINAFIRSHALASTGLSLFVQTHLVEGKDKLLSRLQESMPAGTVFGYAKETVYFDGKEKEWRSCQVALLVCLLELMLLPGTRPFSQSSDSAQETSSSSSSSSSSASPAPQPRVAESRLIAKSDWEKKAEQHGGELFKIYTSDVPKFLAMEKTLAEEFSSPKGKGAAKTSDLPLLFQIVRLRALFEMDVLFAFIERMMPEKRYPMAFSTASEVGWLFAVNPRFPPSNADGGSSGEGAPVTDVAQVGNNGLIFLSPGLSFFNAGSEAIGSTEVRCEKLANTWAPQAQFLLKKICQFGHPEHKFDDASALVPIPCPWLSLFLCCAKKGEAERTAKPQLMAALNDYLVNVSMDLTE
jgi:hypothetical protein